MNASPSAPSTHPASPPSRQLRAWLVLSRGSNLPTVWSNCLAGWWLGGGWLEKTDQFFRVAPLLLGASLLYTAGMWLNDAYDSEWDAAHRPERPIPAGLVSRSSVARAGVVAILLGWACLWPLGLGAVVWTSLLTACIEAYNRVHKRWAHASWLMAACRFCLYPLGASVAGQNMGGAPVYLGGLTVAIYVAGITYLARSESLPGIKALQWPWWVLVLVPVLGWTCVPPGTRQDPTAHWLVFIPDLCWWQYVRSAAARGRPPIAQLLAGLVLIDLMLVPPLGWERPLVFGGLFVVALLFQRWIPAT